jgi:hypothetical protein
LPTYKNVPTLFFARILAETQVLFEGSLLVLGLYFTSNTVAQWFDPWSAKGYTIGICCFSTKAHSIEARICDMELI